MARPSKYPKTKALRDRLREHVIGLSREGKTLAQISAVEIPELGYPDGIPESTMLSWGETKGPDGELTPNAEEFSSILTRAEELRRAAWEDKGDAGLVMGKEFNAAMWARVMAVRHRKHYAEKQQVEHSSPDGGPLPAAGPTQITVISGIPRLPNDPAETLPESIEADEEGSDG
ncbi:MAG: hypothetical protein AAF844_00235 [Pseudomonadota bacterium]